MSEYTTPESTNSAQNVSQTETSATTQFVRFPTRNFDSRQNTHDPQSSSNTPPQRYIITFENPLSPTEEIQNETQNTASFPNTSVNVLSPTRNNPTTSRGLPRSTYDPPSVPFMYRYPNTTCQATNNSNNNQQNDPFTYTIFPPSNTNSSTINQHQEPSQNNNTNIITQHPYEHLLQTNSPQNSFPPQNQTPSYANIVQPTQRRSQNPPLSHIATDPLYQMNQKQLITPPLFHNLLT